VARFVGAIPSYAAQLTILRKSLARRVLDLKKRLSRKYKNLLQQKTAHLDSLLQEKVMKLNELEESLRAQAMIEAFRLAEKRAKEAFNQLFKSLPYEEVKRILAEKLQEKLSRLFQQQFSDDLQHCVILDIESLSASIQMGTNQIVYKLGEEINSAISVKSD